MIITGHHMLGAKVDEGPNCGAIDRLYKTRIATFDGMAESIQRKKREREQ